MHKKTYSILLVISLCLSSWAQDTNIVGTTSPKFRQFLSTHPAAATIFSNVLSEAFSNRTVRLYYFYSDDESLSRASHNYADETVWIFVRENQTPFDEWSSVIFEMLNSEGEKRFKELAKEARTGSISKDDFVREVMKQEFQAVKKTQALIRSFKLSQQEIEESYFYNRFIQCPDDFEGFLSYKKRVSPKRDQIKEYSRLYDSLRKKDKSQAP
jgi:hypothetical protein